MPKHHVKKPPQVDGINGNKNVFENIVSDFSRQDSFPCRLFMPQVFPSTYLWLDHFPGCFL